MKKILFHILILSFLLVTSCGEDFLEQFPPQNVTSSNFYKTEEQMIMAANSVYNQLYTVWGDGALPYLYGDLYGGDSYIYLTVGTSADYIDLAEVVADPGNGPINSSWNSYYRGIFLVNDFLEELENFDANLFKTPNIGARLKAEALFTRACFYYYLTQCFGDVPLVTKVLLPDEALTLTRDTESAVAAQIEEDLNFAANNLPESYSANDVGRPTSFAAKAMLARVYMAYGKKSEAKSALESIINSGKFTLDADKNGTANANDWSYVFNDDTKNSPATVFELQFIPGVNGKLHTYTWSYTPTYNFKIPGYSLTFYTWGLGAVSEALYNAFEVNDTVRRMISAQMYNTDNIYLPHTAKYYWGYNDGTPYYNGSNVPIIRYSEILLNYAEVTNDPQYLNRVRHGVGLPGWGEPGYPADKYPTFAEALEHERRVEFSFEFQRGFDLKRTGRFVTVKSQETGRTISAHQVHFPIPTAVLDVNPEISQNEGY